MSARELAAQVRAGTRKAVDVLDEHLAAIDRREGEIHAFNLVTRDLARSQAEAVDAAVAAGRDPGPLAGVPVALKDNLCTDGIATTCSSRILDRLDPALRRHRRPPARGGRSRHRRQDQPRRVRHGQLHRALGVRTDRQPARRHRRTGRVERRLDRGGRGRVRPRWPSAATPGARSVSPPRSAGWSGPSRPTARCRATASSPSRRASTRSARSRRPSPTPRSCSRSSAATTRSTPRRSSEPRRRSPTCSTGAWRDCGSGSSASCRVTGSRGSAATSSTGSGRPPTRCARPVRSSSRSRCRRRSTACPPTTCSPRPRRRATSPGSTACATGCGSTRPRRAR